jgi:cellulose synthase/poly-beta-1,6-N-acetylglucosamine synthase-like glycosyltransferase
MRDTAAQVSQDATRANVVSETVTSISVCIATHQRSGLLAATLEGLERQIRLPDEIVVSDSSTPESAKVVEAFTGRNPGLTVKYVRSSRKALPWQRSWALQHSSGNVILFLDDDVVLSPQALKTLERAYANLSTDRSRNIAGVGFRMVFDDGTEPKRHPRSFRERWLGMSSLPAGSLTAGGLTVSIAGLEGREPVEVDVLWGGAMSFRREAVADLPLGNLVSLYEAGIGRGEDAVLSFHARRAGRLFVLTEPFAVHPVAPMQVATPYAKEGWRLGLTQTLGRAHTMRWMASNWSAYKRDWRRMVLLELARCGAAIVSRPWRGRSWLRLAGAFSGIGLAVARWSRIPSHPS